MPFLILSAFLIAVYTLAAYNEAEHAYIPPDPEPQALTEGGGYYGPGAQVWRCGKDSCPCSKVSQLRARP